MKLMALYFAAIGITFAVAYAISGDAEKAWKIGAFTALGFIVVLYALMVRRRRR